VERRDEHGVPPLGCARDGGGRVRSDVDAGAAAPLVPGEDVEAGEEPGELLTPLHAVADELELAEALADPEVEPAARTVVEVGCDPRHAAGLVEREEGDARSGAQPLRDGE